MQLAATAALRDLRALVLGDHPLKLAQQLVLGRPGALGLLGEDDLHAGALELFEQQHLIGVAAREAVRCVAQQHLERALDSAIAQPLKRRAPKRRARNALVLENEVLWHQQTARVGQLTQRGGLAVDRLLPTLALGGHPGVDRRHPARRLVRRRDRAAAAHRPSARCLPRDAARAPRSRRPAPAWRRRGGHRRTRSQRAVPPGRSPACSRYARTASAVAALNVCP